MGNNVLRQLNKWTNDPVNAYLTSWPDICTINNFHQICNKIGQGQPRVIIHINFVDLESPMVYAKFKNHGTSGSEEEDIERFWPYTDMAAILVR